MNQQAVADVIRQILTLLGLPFDGCTFDETDAPLLRVDLSSSDPSRIIGWHGETLNAVQHLVKSIVRSQLGLETAPFLVLDVDGYRRGQEDKVKRIAEQKADFVRRKNTRVALPPMSPYFRRVVHLHVARNPDLQDVTTESIGEGDYRQIVIKMKEGPGSGELTPVIAQKETLPSDEDLKGLEDLDV